MAPFATPDDIAAVWRPLTEAEVSVAEGLLAAASAIIRTHRPDVDDRLASGRLDVEVVRHVAVQMARRVLANPEGIRSTTESIDDFTTTAVRDNALSAGELYITDAEMRLLSATPGGRVGSIRLRPGLR